MWNTFQNIRTEARSKDRIVYDNFKKKYELREKRMAKNSTMLFRLTSFLINAWMKKRNLRMISLMSNETL